MSRLLLSPTAIKDCYTIEPRLFEDMRGFFMEAYSRKDFAEAGLPTEWAQDNQSASKKMVLRGLHIQRRNPQGKLVRCTRGQIYDVCLDLRRDSPTYLKWHGEMLSGGKSMYCPPGTAHGFVALEHDSVIYYKCTTLYDGETDGGIFAFCKAFRAHWPINSGAAIMSEKDLRLPTLEQWLEDPRGTWNE